MDTDFEAAPIHLQSAYLSLLAIDSLMAFMGRHVVHAVHALLWAAYLCWARFALGARGSDEPEMASTPDVACATCGLFAHLPPNPAVRSLPCAVWRS